VIIISLIITGLVVGGLGRLAVPGPDPMPIWLTIIIGIVGSVVGGMIAYAFTRSVALYFLFEVGVASLLVIAYRRFVQGRPITGPGARRLDR
jgi:uncharacterized membrane protein YeaQ/YmgE (transglycosylase-associated protein family)